MKSTPYSLTDAEERCKAFQYLCGQHYAAGQPATIDCIAVAPFDAASRNRFIMYYLLFDDAQVALQQDYQGLLFDVIIIAGAKDGSEMMHEPLDMWLARNGAAILPQPVIPAAASLAF